MHDPGGQKALLANRETVFLLPPSHYKPIMSGNKTQILSLYRQFLRYSNKFEDYNFRNYFLRKTKTDFKKHKDVTDPSKAAEFIKQAQEDLVILKRQATISQMYHFDKLVVERLDRHHH